MFLGICFVLTVLGNVISTPILTQVGMGLGGTLLAPIYFIWLGVNLLKKKPQPMLFNVANQTTSIK